MSIIENIQRSWCDAQIEILKCAIHATFADLKKTSKRQQTGCNSDFKVFLRKKCLSGVDSDGLIGKVQRHQDVRTVLHDAHQQVIDVLLQLGYLLVPVRQLLVLFEHQRDELGSSQLAIWSFGATAARLRGDTQTMITDTVTETKAVLENANDKSNQCAGIKPSETRLTTQNSDLRDVCEDFCGFFIRLVGDRRWFHRAEGFHR